MACEQCTWEMCHRRGVQLPPRLQALCETRSDYAAILDRRHGIKDESVIPDSGKPDEHRPNPKPKELVGNAFETVVRSIGINKLGGCGCGSAKGEMNRLGIAGCRRERDRLIDRLRENARRVGWMQKLIAVPLSVWTGLAFKVNPLDPLPGMFDEAVRITETEVQQD